MKVICEVIDCAVQKERAREGPLDERVREASADALAPVGNRCRNRGGGRLGKRVKQAGKRDSVTALAGYDGHSSRPCVAARLEPPTRRLGGPRRRLPT